MERIIASINNMDTKENFVDFIQLLLEDLKTNPISWENKDLSSYLEGIGSWTEDMDGYYENNNIPVPQNVDWKVFANILVAAKMYE